VGDAEDMLALLVVVPFVEIPLVIVPVVEAVVIEVDDDDDRVVAVLFSW